MSVSYGGDSIVFADGSVQSGGWTGMRNRIINGAMVIDQRNAGASVTPTASAYTIDRWEAGMSAASKFSVQRSTVAPTGFTNSLIATSTSAYTAGAGEIFALTQFIEGYNVDDMGFGTANASTFTISFWVRSSLTGTFGGALQNSNRTRSYPFTYTINQANTWEKETITFVGDTTGTWVTGNGRGLNVIFSLGAGSTYSGTANAWATANYYSATGATSVVGTNGATFYITGVQLERGSTASSFEYRPFGTELALCQRYYEEGNYSQRLSGTIIRQAWPYAVQKRQTASVNVYYDTTKATSGTINKSNTTDSGWATGGNQYMGNMEKNTYIQLVERNNEASFNPGVWSMDLFNILLVDRINDLENPYYMNNPERACVSPKELVDSYISKHLK
jgi:hypothetical protein